MRVKLILPALTEATSPFFRPVKYSLFPPLGLATLAAFLSDDDEVTIQDEHVEKLDLDDEPDLVVIQVYVTSAKRSYALADHYRGRGAWVALGGLHVTSLPEEAAAHADTIFLGPGEDTWPRFLADLRDARPGSIYRSRTRTLEHIPPPRRDLLRRELYLVPNSLVVSRGCPHHCAFCYKDAFFEGGRGFYTQTVDDALAEIERLRGRHLYFLDDNLLGDPRFAGSLFEGMRGMGRVWQAAGTIQSVLRPGLLEQAVEAGLRSLFVGFETLDPQGLRSQNKHPNLGRNYDRAVRRLHDLGVMINASFVFGMDGEDEGVFDRTVDWAVSRGIETATFHILTPYPGTALHRRMQADGRILHSDWDRYDTRHAVFRPNGMTTRALEEGYWRAYNDFYRWGSIFEGARTKPSVAGALRHFTYAAAWKKFEPLWDALIRTHQVFRALPLLETVLGRGRPRRQEGNSVPSLQGPSPARRDRTSATARSSDLHGRARRVRRSTTTEARRGCTTANGFRGSDSRNRPGAESPQPCPARRRDEAMILGKVLRLIGRFDLFQHLFGPRVVGLQLQSTLEGGGGHLVLARRVQPSEHRKRNRSLRETRDPHRRDSGCTARPDRRRTGA